jgi:hypothetical protein
VHEKRGKFHEVSAHHNAGESLDTYNAAARAGNPPTGARPVLNVRDHERLVNLALDERGDRWALLRRHVLPWVLKALAPAVLGTEEVFFAVDGGVRGLVVYFDVNASEIVLVFADQTFGMILIRRRPRRRL